MGEEQMMMPQGVQGMQMPQEQAQPGMQMPQGAPMGQPGMQMPQEESEGISTEEQIAKVMEILSSQPELAQEVSAKIERSGLPPVDIELLGTMAALAIEYPSSYEKIVGGIVAMFPELADGLTGEISQDGESLTDFVVSAVVNEGGAI